MLTSGLFLFGTTTAASLTYTSSNRKSVKENAKSRNVLDCIIIGAGASGLQCGKSLVADHNISQERILVIEAQPYIGGRIKQTSDFVKRFKIDLGAEILHGTGTRLNKFAEENNQPLQEMFCWAHGDGGPLEHAVNGGYGLYYISNKGKPDRLIRYDDDDSDFVKVNEALWKLPDIKEDGIPPESSILDYLNEQTISHEMMEMAAAGYSNTLCANSDEMSLQQTIRWSRLWNEESEVDGDFRFKNSYACLIDYLKKGLNILMDCPVTTIDYSAGRSSLVELTTTDGQVFQARCAVVTASPNVLKSGLINFTPELPLFKVEALANVTMNRAMKILLKFKVRPWPEKLQGIIMSGDNCPVPEAWFRDVTFSADEATAMQIDGIVEEATCIATGFACARYADALMQLPEDQLIKRFLAQLDDAFANLASRHMSADSVSKTAAESTPIEPLPSPSSVFLGGMVHDWKAFPYIAGGYSSTKVGRGAAAPGLAAPLKAGAEGPAVFFAGEATNLPAATAHAALETGVRAAKEVAEFLRS